MPSSPPSPSSARSALIVGLGILLSRIAGLLRERVFAHYFGSSEAADAFKAALRIPNLLQNLLGEGVLSASLIPVYARLRAEDRALDATRVASAVGALLALVLALLVALGVGLTPWTVDLLAPGFEGEKRNATIHFVRILFPGVGLLVLSAWCIGVLNSHRRFLLSYTAPILWNIAQIAVLVVGGRHSSGYRLGEWASFGAVAGSLLQFLVQLPTVLGLLGAFRPSIRRVSALVREVMKNFGPVMLGRGVVQLSAYVDSILASWLPTGAVAALAYAQILYTLPISLFGMAVSAAELPEMSSVVGAESEVAAAIRGRIETAQLRVAFFVVPSALVFLGLGDLVASAFFETGSFTHADATYLWTILAGATIGLLAVTLGRLYASAFYALHDTRRPLRFAVVRLVLTTVLGWFSALVLPGILGLADSWGAAGLTASSGVAGWVEFWLLRRSLIARIGPIPIDRSAFARLWLAAILSTLIAWGVRLWLPRDWSHPWLLGSAVLAPYAACYLATTWAMRLAPARQLVRSVVVRFGGHA